MAKISNMILKNIFVILKRKGYIISQKYSKNLINLLKGYYYKFYNDKTKQSLFEEKVSKIENIFINQDKKKKKLILLLEILLQIEKGNII